jgi:hypothetical protein
MEPHLVKSYVLKESISAILPFFPEFWTYSFPEE